MLTSVADVDMVCLHHYGDRHNKVYCIWIEQRHDPQGTVIGYTVMAGWGRATAENVQQQQSKQVSTDLENARYFAHGLIRERQDRGYENVLSSTYQGGLSFQTIANKVHPKNLSHGPSHRWIMNNTPLDHTFIDLYNAITGQRVAPSNHHPRPAPSRSTPLPTPPPRPAPVPSGPRSRRQLED